MNELEVKRVPFMGTDLMAAKDESGTMRSKFRFGGTSRHRVISRSQLARQIADLAMYQPE